MTKEEANSKTSIWITPVSFQGVWEGLCRRMGKWLKRHKTAVALVTLSVVIAGVALFWVPVWLHGRFEDWRVSLEKRGVTLHYKWMNPPWDARIVEYIPTPLLRLFQYRLLDVRIHGDDVDGETLGTIVKMGHIRYFLADGASQVDDNIMRALAESAELEVLIISRTSVSPKGLRYLCRFPRLEHLVLNGMKLSGEDLQYLDTLGRLTPYGDAVQLGNSPPTCIRIESLRVVACPGTADAARTYELQADLRSDIPTSPDSMIEIWFQDHKAQIRRDATQFPKVGDKQEVSVRRIDTILVSNNNGMYSYHSIPFKWEHSLNDVIVDIKMGFRLKRHRFSFEFETQKATPPAAN